MYRQGQYPDTPEGISVTRFHSKIQEWVRIAEACGPEALKHKAHNKVWSAEERYALIARVIAGESICSVAVSVGIHSGQLSHWVRKYRVMGYNGLVDKRKRRKRKEPTMKKLNYNNPKKREESEHEELIRLRAENQ